MNKVELGKSVNKLLYTHFYDEFINGFNLRNMEEKMDDSGYDIYIEIPVASYVEGYSPDQFIQNIKEKFDDFLLDYFKIADCEIEREDLQYIQNTFYCRKYDATWTEIMSKTTKEFIDKRLEELNKDDGFVEV